MKLVSKLLLAGLAAMSQAAWADTGPYYVQLTGYCNVKKVYLNTYNDIYGTEVGCSTSMGSAQMGYLTTSGIAVVTSPRIGGGVCLETFSVATGVTSMMCSAGNKVDYYADSRFVLRQSATPETARPVPFTISTEMPDLEKLKHLPSRQD